MAKDNKNVVNRAPASAYDTTPKSDKAKRNQQAHQERLEILKQRQKLVADLRKQGFTGRTDKEVIAAWNLQKLQTELDEREAVREKLQMEYRLKCQKYIDDVLSTPGAGNTIRRWLNVRIERTPQQVYSLITNFLQLPHNAGHADSVMKHLANLDAAAAGQAVENEAA